METLKINRQPNYRTTLPDRIFQGAIVALLLVAFILTLLGTSYTRCPQWMILPLILVPIAGGIGGFVFYATDQLRQFGGRQKKLANVISYAAYTLIVVVTFALTVKV